MGGGGPSNVTQNTKSDPWIGMQGPLSNFYQELDKIVGAGGSGGGTFDWAKTAPWIQNLAEQDPRLLDSVNKIGDVGLQLYQNPREPLAPGMMESLYGQVGAGPEKYARFARRLNRAGNTLMSKEGNRVRDLTGKTREQWLNPQDDPNTQALMKATTRPIRQEMKQNLLHLGSRASMQGAVGGSRQQLLEAQTMKQAGREMADVRAGILSDAARRGEQAIQYGKAEQGRRFAQGANMTSGAADILKGGSQAGVLNAQTLGQIQNLFNFAQDRPLNDMLQGLGLYGQAGEQGQAMTREQLGEQNRRWQEQAYGPLNFLQQYGSTLQGGGGVNFGSTSTTGPNPNARGSNRITNGIGGLMAGSTIGGFAGGAAAGAPGGPPGIAIGALLGTLLGALA